MLPLQHYHGIPLIVHNQSNSKRHETHLDLNKISLSKSSQILSKKEGSPSDDERRRFHSKIRAEARASQPLDPTRDLHILYRDSDIVVTNKPSGILCVPGPRRNPSLANLVHSELHTPIDIDKTVIHRLDMDTSGIVVFAASEQALSTLHDDFRHRQVLKTYQALVCGHVQASEMEIDLALERDPHHPPFMRVAQPKDMHAINTDIPAVSKFMNQAPKPSLTELRVLSWETLGDDCLPVTRLELRPHTGRTHQLRVHCASVGHPIIGDDIYGYNGEGARNGGLAL
jgi:RluA family pseudouridine synthase